MAFILRKMTSADLLETFLMRNDEAVCRFAENPRPISWSEHESVFRYTTYPKYVYTSLVSEVPKFEEIIGYVEFRNDMVNDDPDLKIWAFHLDDEWRGKGLSESMLKDAIKEAKKLGIKYIQGNVKKDNLSSIRLHNKLKFDKIRETDEDIIFELNLA